MPITKFNLRVYGILFNRQSVLITDEHQGGFQMTKFPGGGLEKGEGLHDCLIREFQEELGIDITVKSLFYVNEFFQQSAFKKEDQLISFYFLIENQNNANINVTKDRVVLKSGDQSFRWIKRTDLKSVEFTFPIDKIVGKLLSK